MPDPNAPVTLTWAEWQVLKDRANFAEDRLRICRHNVKLHRELPWWPGQWLKMLRAVRQTLRAGETQDGP